MATKLTSRTIAFIVLAASVVIAVSWYFMMYQPAVAQLETIRAEIATLEDRKRVGENARRNVVQLCSTVAELRVEKAAFLRKLPRTEQLSGLLTELRDRIATNKGLLQNVARSRDNDASLPAGVTAISLSLGVRATFGDFYSILASVENLQRFSKMRTLALTVDQQATTFDPNLNAQMRLTAFVYDAPADGADTAEPTDVANPVCQATPAATLGSAR